MKLISLISIRISGSFDILNKPNKSRKAFFSAYFFSSADPFFPSRLLSVANKMEKGSEREERVMNEVL